MCQKQQVKKVKCLLNFNEDFFYPESLRGLSVELFGGYVLSESDRLWLHPALGRSLTVFETGHGPDEIAERLDELRGVIRAGSLMCRDGDQSAGLYVYRTTDEYAVMVEDYRLVIEHIPDYDAVPPLEGTLSAWVQKYIAMARTKDVLSEIKTMALQSFPGATMVSHKTTNTFFKTNDSLVYVNYAWNITQRDKSAYVKLHPSLGYIKYEVEPHRSSIIVPSTIGYESVVTTWDDMDSRRLSHIQATLSWTNERLPFHRHIQRDAVRRTAAVDGYIATLGCHRGQIMYSKSVMCGSSTAKFTPSEVTKLTATKAVAFPTHELIEMIAAKHSEVWRKLGINIFNPEFINEESTEFTFTPTILRTLCE